VDEDIQIGEESRPDGDQVGGGATPTEEYMLSQPALTLCDNDGSIGCT